jgi:hypothetical protein
MAKLKLHRITCKKTDDPDETDAIYDVGLEDEPYILVNGKEVWTGRMSPGEVIDLSDIDPFPFRDSVKIELMERETGHGRNDDVLGEITVNESEVNMQKIVKEIQKGKAEYILEYYIVES